MGGGAALEVESVFGGEIYKVVICFRSLVFFGVFFLRWSLFSDVEFTGLESVPELESVFTKLRWRF